MRKFFLLGLIFVLALVMTIVVKVGWFKSSLNPASVSSTTEADQSPSAPTLDVSQEKDASSELLKSETLLDVPKISVPAPAVKVASISASGPIVIADFDTGDKPNNLGGDFGSWNKDPEDETQGCGISFETDDALNDPSGYSLKLDYDVDSPNPAYNGFWMKLNGQSASNYDTLSFYVRGEGLNNFTNRIKLELKDSSMNSAPYIVSGITDAWQKIEVPFDRFKKIKDWSSLGEFVVVFDDQNSNPKQGTILIDQIAFEKK